MEALRLYRSTMAKYGGRKNGLSNFASFPSVKKEVGTITACLRSATLR